MTDGAYIEVDTEIRQLVIDLNDAGYATTSSCQGKRNKDDFKLNRHCAHAFVTFVEIPARLKRMSTRYGLEIYNGGLSICPKYENNDPYTYIKHNLKFEDNMRSLFGIVRVMKPSNKDQRDATVQHPGVKSLDRPDTSRGDRAVGGADIH